MNDTLAAQRAGLDPLALRGIAPPAAEIDVQEVAPTLPRDHPAWQRDVLSISQRARALLATLRPVVVAVLTFWDHRLREIALGPRTLGVDPSGCYRLR